MRTPCALLLTAVLLPPPPACALAAPAGAVVLFDGHDTSAWVRRDGKPGGWPVEEGAMVSAGSDLDTKQSFQDLVIHLEFMTEPSPPSVKGQGRSNSGVYLQGRYEVQILDSYGVPPGPQGCGAIYLVRAPDTNACRKPGEWQSYDIVFTAARFDPAGMKIANARLTVRQNGVLIHPDAEVPDRTGHGDPEGPDPRPLRLQYHGNKVRFRNVWVASGAAAASAAAPESASPITITREPDGVRVEIGGRLFTRYRLTQPDGQPLVRPFLYPVLLDGAEMTSDQTMIPGGDHPHHRSIWVAHGEVNGVDHWAGKAVQRPRGEIGIAGDTLSHELVWEGTNGEPILVEHRTLRFLELPGGNRAIDLTVTLSPAGTRVVLGDVKDAGLCSVRVAAEISAKPVITNSAGAEGESKCRKAPAEWCDISGTVAGKPCGIAVLDHPENPRFPTWWHVRAYGLLAANPFGLTEFKKAPKGTGDMVIEPGKAGTFRYRVVVHRGDAKAARLADRFDEFAGTGGPAMVPLFNGRDLAGWRVPSPNPWWTVVDGVLVGIQDAAARGNVLETEARFHDLILELEYRYSGDVDSGVFVRAGHKWQCQIGVSRSLRRDLTGSIYDSKRKYVAEAKEAPALNREGQWNRLRIDLRGARTRVWLNGTRVLDYTDDAFPGSGPVGLQIHGGVKDMKIEFRNIRYLPLDPAQP